VQEVDRRCTSGFAFSELASVVLWAAQWLLLFSPYRYVGEVAAQLSPAYGRYESLGTTTNFKESIIDNRYLVVT
jgi:hypothetical protein